MFASTNLVPTESHGWKAHLELTLAHQRDRTIVQRARHQGPLRVQRAFYPEADGTCHVYLLHPPGGVVQGDELEVFLELKDSSQCLITTPGATKLYRSEEQCCRISANIRVGRGARCEWLPQETIAFCGARAVLATQVELEPGASFIGWDVLCLGRPAAGEHFVRGELSSRLSVTRTGAPLLCEHLVLDGGSPALHQAWGMRGFSAVGMLVLAVPDRQWVESVRARMSGAPESDTLTSGTELDGISVFRAMGRSTEAVKHALTEIWQCCREQLGTDGNHLPRIWAS